MNNLNYASFEASKKLVAAGIVLETDWYWVKLITKEEWVLSTLDNVVLKFYESIPAPSMAEVLKELPNNTAFLKNKIYYASTGGKDNAYKEFISTNPTDALINLLIWTRKEKS